MLAGSAAAQNLQLTVTEGDGLEVSAGSRSFSGVSILVTDRIGNPVPQAKVTFRLPESGPSGFFPNGKRVEDQTSDVHGKAAAWGIQWGTVEGTCNVAITAQIGSLSAGTMARVRIIAKGQQATTVASFEVDVPKTPAAAAPAPPTEATPTPDAAKSAERRPGVLWTQTERGEERISSGRAKWIVVTLAAAGAVGGFAAYKLNGKTPGTAAAIVTTGPVLTLSVPTITIGKP